MKRFDIFLFVLILMSSNLFGQETRNVKPLTLRTVEGEEINLYNNSFALMENL